MNSIFTNIYKYRQTDKKNEIENYLIEIFSYCLQKDDVFKNNFFDKIGFENNNGKILTQKTFSNGKRPDICIEDNKNLFLIECKVGADEGENQLANYQQILAGYKNKKTKLIFLTKHIVEKENAEQNITWTDIAEMITDKNNILTSQLKEYLIENNIAFMEGFNKGSLSTMYKTLQKMEYILDTIKNDYKIKKTEHDDNNDSLNYAQNSRCSKLKSHNAFFDKINMENKVLDIGFFGFNTSDITIGVRYYVFDEKEMEKLENKFIKNKDGWIKQVLGKGSAWIGKYQLLNKENISVKDCVKFIHDTLKEI